MTKTLSELSEHDHHESGDIIYWAYQCNKARFERDEALALAQANRLSVEGLVEGTAELVAEREEALAEVNRCRLDMRTMRAECDRLRDRLDCRLREGGDTLHCRPDRPCERCRRLLAEMERDRLRSLLATICDGFDQGVFCRDVSGDARGDWAIQLLPHLKALADAKVAVKAAAALEG